MSYIAWLCYVEEGGSVIKYLSFMFTLLFYGFFSP